MGKGMTDQKQTFPARLLALPMVAGIGYAVKQQQAIQDFQAYVFAFGRNPLEATKAVRKLAQGGLSTAQAISRVKRNVDAGGAFDD